MSDRPIRLEPSWLAALEPEFQQPYMVALRAFLAEEVAEHVVYPPGGEMFAAFDHCPLDQVRVVFLGQDPYHGAGQAHGLCFSVRKGVPTPPSLRNIFKELHDDLGVPVPSHGELTHWADQGVLLLNTCLSVRANAANSHRNQGWEQLTDRVIELLDAQRRSLVFVLWGSPAGRKAQMIDGTRHLILKAPHPSPLAAYRGFFGCGHFRRIGEHLERHGEPQIDWALPA